MRINFLVASCLHFYPEIIRHIVICFVCFEEIRISTKNNRIGTIFNIKETCHIISQCSHDTGTSIFQAGIQNIFQFKRAVISRKKLLSDHIIKVFSLCDLICRIIICECMPCHGLKGSIFISNPFFRSRIRFIASNRLPR